jgi:hypothetical protein
MKNVFVIFVFTWILFAGLAQSAQLDPFELPSGKAEQGMQNNAPPPSKKLPVVDEAVYEKFKARVNDLGQEEKKKWSLSFKEKQKDAISREKWDEVKHYQRLLKLLEPDKKGVE